jgi:hypothetical protein
MQAVAVQPVTVTLHAVGDYAIFQQFQGGVLGPEACPGDPTNNHAVVVVGYDATGGPGAPGTYWKLRVRSSGHDAAKGAPMLHVACGGWLRRGCGGSN